MKASKYILIALVCLPLTARGEDFLASTDLGFFGGGAYYLGDINKRQQFYSLGPSAGMLLKHNFNPHHVLRANITYGQVKANDLDFKNDYQLLRGSKFTTDLLELQAGWEFNFHSYMSTRKEKAHSPYIFMGLSYTFIMSSTVPDAEGFVSIPFGVGYKYRFSDSFSAGCEWGLRKTFTDKLDGVGNPGPDGSPSTWHGNDWYSFVGIFITFRIFEESFKCSAYRQPPVR